MHMRNPAATAVKRVAQKQRKGRVSPMCTFPQFTIFPFYKILSPSEGMRNLKNKERFFSLKYKPVLNELELR